MPYEPPAYDPGNVFARLLRGEIPSRPLLDTPHALAFADRAPQAPVHALLIPKGAYTDLADFAARASAEEQAGFLAALAELVGALGLEGGFRAIANTGAHAHQEVPHFHLHVLGGEPIGPLRAR